MNLKEVKAAIECLIFVSAEPLTAKKIGEIIELDEKTIKILARELAEDYTKRESGIQLVEVNGAFMLTTRKEYAEIVSKLCTAPPPAPLSLAAMETLSIIAYKQPITKAEIEAIRGVKVDRALATLLERELIREVGRKETIGKPILYGTTEEFLKYLGLKDIADLPVLKEEVEEIDSVQTDAKPGEQIHLGEGEEVS